MRLSLMAAAAAAFLLATPSLAQEVEPVSKPDAGEAVVADKDKVVCRSVRLTTSRMPVRKCETVGQREVRMKSIRDRQAKMDTEGASKGKSLK